MEVTSKNFSDLLPELTLLITTCEFVAIDLELSGLSTDSSLIYTLFDLCPDRYLKLKQKTEGIICTQIGLTAFSYTRKTNSYISNTFTFHLLPQYIGDIEQKCVFEASVFDFFKRNKFDFNKCILEGIPYLNRDEVSHLEDGLKRKDYLDNLSPESLETLISVLKSIEIWIKSSDENPYVVRDQQMIFPILLHKLSETYQNIGISLTSSALTLNKKSSEGIENVQRQIIRYATGFSHIINILQKSQKPLIFHNAFTDLTIIYKQFVGSLPNTLAEFKRCINQTFPVVYDTKNMFLTIRTHFRKEKVSDNSSLANLYNFFKDKPITINSPRIEMNTKFEHPNWFHHAGWDSYCTGYCFVHTMHVIASENNTIIIPLYLKEYFSSVINLRNKIYFSRGAQPFMCLNDTDPSCYRPCHLHVEWANDKNLNIEDIVDLISRIESVDVKRLGKNTALIAVINNTAIKKILNYFKNDKSLKITKYNVLQHSPALRLSLWSCFFLSTSILGIYLYRIIK